VPGGLPKRGAVSAFAEHRDGMNVVMSLAKAVAAGTDVVMGGVRGACV
jgi:hypothetical protein